MSSFDAVRKSLTGRGASVRLEWESVEGPSFGDVPRSSFHDSVLSGQSADGYMPYKARAPRGRLSVALTARSELRPSTEQCCEVDGCSAAVGAGNTSRRHRVCKTHARACSAIVDGTEQRFW